MAVGTSSRVSLRMQRRLSACLSSDAPRILPRRAQAASVRTLGMMRALRRSRWSVYCGSATKLGPVPLCDVRARAHGLFGND